MSAPFIWVVVPMLAGMGFWLIRERQSLVVLLATIFGLVLALAAFLLPFGQLVQVGPWSFSIDPTLAFAGRRLLLQNGDRPVLIFFYLVCAFWFAGALAANANRLLIPFGYGIVALLVAALAVEPFLYAALLIEMAVLLAVPLIASPALRFPGRPPDETLAENLPMSRGLLRFLIFQTLAMPFILLAGWALETFESNPVRTELALLAAIFLGLGFSFWLAVFPFYSWVLLLAEQNAPYPVGFLLLVLPAADLLLGLNFLASYNWLHATPPFLQTIRVMGVIMIGTAGLLSAFQTNLLRLFGYAVVIEIGFSLLAISLYNPIGGNLFSSMFLPRLIGLGIWTLALSILLPAVSSARFSDVVGLAARYPFACAGLGVAGLSLAGLPLLGGFPIRQVLLEELARQSLIVSLVALLGTVGMLFGAFRSLAVLARNMPFPIAYHESRIQISLLVLGIVGLLVIGILPPVFLPLLFPLAPMP
jgi:NADH-quinone oxidoreductase subunit N